MERLLLEIKEYILGNTVQEILKKNLLRFFNITDNELTLEELKDKFRNEEFNELRVNIEYFERSITDIKNNFDKYLWVYDNLLEDEQSKRAYLYMIHAKVFMLSADIEKAYTDDIIYFDKGIIGGLNSENYVDCGGYVGDTALQFIKQCPNFFNIYVYEPLDNLVNQCQEKLDYFINEGSVILKKFAVYSEVKELRFSIECGKGDSKVVDNGELIINASTLDKDIKDRITFIKMDIEGSEKNAILGAKSHIKNDNPKMAICIYHLESDFWEIPKLIKSINENYTFKIRQHSQDSFSETVLYCLPKSNNENKNSNIDKKTISKRCEEVLKSINFISQEEKDNILGEMKFHKWYLAQLRNFKYENLNKDKIINDLNNWANKQEESKEWLSNQLNSHIDIINEQKEYINKLMQDKEWIEGQWNSTTKELKEQKEYTNKLIEDKEWIEGQWSSTTKELREQKEYSNKLIEDKEWIEGQWNSTIKELKEQKEYTNKLIEDKEWIIEQWNSLKNNYNNVLEKIEKYEEEIELLKNNLLKVNYKFNRIKSDKLINKIIKFKKYEI